MEQNRIPKPGELYKHFKDKSYQIITVATHSENRELMVVYQALYGDFKTYVRPLEMFISEVDHVKYPDVKQKYRFELKSSFEDIVCGNIANGEEKFTQPAAGLEISVNEDAQVEASHESDPASQNNTESEMTGEVNSILMEFLDQTSYSKKLDVLILNKKHLNDRLINDMAVALDIAVDEGPLETRIQGLVNCLSALSRFEHRRLR